MASLSRDKGSKRWRIQFMDATGGRKTLRFSGLTKAQAQQVRGHLENIISARAQGISLDMVDATWLSSLSDTVHAKLVKAGLDLPRSMKQRGTEEKTMSLGKFFEEFESAGLTAKGEPASVSTIQKWRAPMRYLIECLSYEQDIETVTHEDAHAFRQWLDQRRIKPTKANPKGQPMAENAIRKLISSTKVFFNSAKRRGLISFNPFEYQVSSTKWNRQRDFFVTIELTEVIIDACPDAEWRLLVALWRYAGLRKMEVMRLTWDDVLWTEGKMRVHASKTAHHDGREIRYVPLRDIREYLEVVQAESTDGSIHVISRFSASNSNLDKPLKVILEHAGIEPWPKLFQNMRASCETQWLDEGHPDHVVAGWLGHTVEVQRESYAQITEGHFEAFNAGGRAVSKSVSNSVSDHARIRQNGREKRETSGETFPRKTQRNLENPAFSRLFSAPGRT